MHSCFIIFKTGIYLIEIIIVSSSKCQRKTLIAPASAFSQVSSINETPILKTNNLNILKVTMGASTTTWALTLTCRSSSVEGFLVVPFEFKKFFVLCGNDVIKTVLRNVNVGNVIFPPVQKMGQDHPVDGLMADDHNIISAPV